ncbi:MAG TPA: hypothetical protein VGC73_06490 [Pyrinomonadaceae bacterium]|jgi:hypothetical protein
MTEDEYKLLKAMIERVTGQEKRLKAHAQDAEDPFTPVINGILDLLAVGKKRLIDRLGGQRPPLND